MKHSRLKILGSILLGGLLIGGLSGCKRHSPEEKAEYIQYRISKKLELNETQQAKLKELADEGLKIYKERRAKRPEMISDVQAMIRSNDLTTDQIVLFAESRRKPMEEIIPLMAEKLVAFQKTLSTEQREKLVEIMNKFTKRHRNK